MVSWQLLSLGEHPASANGSIRTVRAEQKKPAHKSSCALAKGTICSALCQQNFPMWKESFSISFQHLNLLLGFWAYCTHTTSSGLWARQCLCGETTERVRLSSHRHSPGTSCLRAPPLWENTPLFGGDTQAAPKGSEQQRKAVAPCTPRSEPFLSASSHPAGPRAPSGGSAWVIGKMKLRLAAPGPQVRAPWTDLCKSMETRPPDKSHKVLNCLAAIHFKPSNEKAFKPSYQGFARWLGGKQFACQAGDASLIPGSGRSLGEWNGNPLQYSCLRNPVDRGAWQTIVHGVTESQTRLSD